MEVINKMKIKEMVLVTENWKGKETNFLCDFDDYIKGLFVNIESDMMEIAHHTQELERTKIEDNLWTDFYYVANKSISARYCKDLNQLRTFLRGGLNSTDQEIEFDEARCSKECLLKLKSIGLETDGKRISGYREHYEEMKAKFEVGQTLYNFNGSQYRVLELLSDKNLLLMNLQSGNFVVGIGTKLYARYPQGDSISSDSCVIAIEWEHGVYLSRTPSCIDFEELRKEYGTPLEITTLTDYRNSLERHFRTLLKILNHPELDEEVKVAARNSLYGNFCTAKENTFYEKLESGEYDDGFIKNDRSKEMKSWAR